MVYENVSIVVSKSQQHVDDGRIVAVYFDKEIPTFNDEYEIIDLNGDTVVPGFIDSHVHCESTLLLPSRTGFIAQRGTVACIADPHEITNVLGEYGFNIFIEDSKKSLVDYRFTIPSCVPATDNETSGARVTSDIVKKILDNDIEKAKELQKASRFATNCRKVIGLAEVMNVPGTLDPGFVLLQDILTESRSLSAHIDGHAPSCNVDVLNKYISAGVKTDHECCDFQELLDRIRRGMTVLIREGTAGKNAHSLCKGLSSLPRAATRNVCFCTDDRRIDDIISEGHIDNIIRIAVQCGIHIHDALRMASLNPAEHYGLIDYGSIAPGKIGSFCVIKGPLEECNVSKVYIRGRDISTALDPIIETPKNANTMNVNMDLVKKSLENAVFKGPAIGVIPNSLLTTSEDPCGNSLKLVVIERYTGKSEMGHCLINGITLNPNSAVASTVAHDSHNIVCVGNTDNAMLMAIQSLVESGGGYSVFSNGFIDVLPLPIAGLMTTISKQELLESLHHFHSSLLLAGASKDFDLMMTLSFMCLPVIPKLKLTNKGLFDAEKFQFVH